MINKEKVIKFINALASSLDNGHTVDELEVMYYIGYNQLNRKEKQAFHEGVLALFARVGNMKTKSLIHEAKFAKLMK